MKILIIEDNVTNMKLASTLLQREQHTVLEAFDADEGIRVAKKEKPDLILMDIHLPGMDGLTATKILKKHRSTRHIPVIALTAFAMLGDEERILATDCDAYIAKPFRYKNFVQVINQFLAIQHETGCIKKEIFPTMKIRSA